MTLPSGDRIVSVLRTLSVLGPNGHVEVEMSRAGAVVREDGLDWVVTELPTSAQERAGVVILIVDLDHDGRGPGIGVAVPMTGACWRLDHEDEAKDLLRVLARTGAVDAMAAVLAMFQSGGAAQRALDGTPDLLVAIGVPEHSRPPVHAPCFTAGPDESGWRLEFWSVATPHLRANRYTLHNWTVTCEGDDVAWWAAPEWTTP